MTFQVFVLQARGGAAAQMHACMRTCVHGRAVHAVAVCHPSGQLSTPLSLQSSSRPLIY